MNNECQSAPQSSLPTLTPADGAEQLGAQKHHAANRHFDPLEAGFFDAGDEQQGDGAELHADHDFRDLDPAEARASRAVRRRLWTGLSICGACALLLAVGAGFGKDKQEISAVATAEASAVRTPPEPEHKTPFALGPAQPTESPAPAQVAATPDPSTTAAAPAPAAVAPPATASAEPGPAPAAALAPIPALATEPTKAAENPVVADQAKQTKPEAPAAAPTVAADKPAATAEDAPGADDLGQRCLQLAKQRKLKDVVDVCGRAFAAGATTAEVAVTIARAEFDRGRGTQAGAWARRAIERNADTADAYVYVGMAEQESGHRAAAKAAYQRYLQLAPKGRYASDLRSVVNAL